MSFFFFLKEKTTLTSIVVAEIKDFDKACKYNQNQMKNGTYVFENIKITYIGASTLNNKQDLMMS